MKTLHSLFACQPIRELVLRYTSAFDAAKLDQLHYLELSPYERKTYLRPVRDLIWNIEEAEELWQEGMKLILLGDDVRALEQRLHESNRYQKHHGHRRLNIYLIGAFPTLDRTETTVDRLINFNTFGAPTEFSGESREGLWYKVPDVPDKTVDLRVYVPTFGDMLNKEVRMTLLDLSRICRMNEAYSHTRPLSRLVRICTGRFRLQQWCLWAHGELVVEETALGRLLAVEDAVQDLWLGLRFAGSETPALQAPAIHFQLDLKLSFKAHFYVHLPHMH